MLGRHPLHGLAGAENAAGDIHRHHVGDAFGSHLIDADGRADDAGIVDQRAERTEGVGRLEQRENVSLGADIAFHGDGLAVGRFDLRNDLIRRGFVAGVADDDLEAACGRCERRRAADAAASAGDDDDAVGHVRCSSFS